MQRVSEWELVVFCGGGGQPAGLAAAQNISLHSEGFRLQTVLHPPTPYPLSPLLKGGEGRGEGGIIHPCAVPLRRPPRDLIPNFQQRVSEWEKGHWEWRQPPAGAGAT